MKQRRFCLIQIHNFRRPKSQYLSANFRTDTARRACNQDCFSKQGRIHILLIQLYYLSAQQFMHIQSPQANR